MDKEKEAVLQGIVDTYNEAEKKIQEIDKKAVGVREQFKLIYMQEKAQQQHIQYECMQQFEEILGKNKK